MTENENHKNYVPLNELLSMDEKWTFINLHRNAEDLATSGVILWCYENMRGKWTLRGAGKFGFECPLDALAFKLQHGE